MTAKVPDQIRQGDEAKMRIPGAREGFMFGS